LEEILAFVRDRESITKAAAKKPGDGHSFESWYSQGMAAEYIGDAIQSVIGRMYPKP
jgi:hypothetical protein